MVFKTRTMTVDVDVEANTIACTRVLDGGIHRITMECDGSVGDLGAKVERVGALTNDMFKSFSNLQKEANSIEENT